MGYFLLVLVGIWIVWAFISSFIEKKELDELKEFIKKEKLEEYPFKDDMQKVLSYTRYLADGKEACGDCKHGRIRIYQDGHGYTKNGCNNPYCKSNNAF
ncbi:hypothetical protein HOC54_01715 [Candidatus Peregrinibacteria bacterium]|jgi:hypothetical protein|nr:hypothetical protein [Candidatus Peregrinibacteria bacterium]